MNDADHGWSIAQCEIVAVIIRLITWPFEWSWSWLINCAMSKSGSDHMADHLSMRMALIMADQLSNGKERQWSYGWSLVHVNDTDHMADQFCNVREWQGSYGWSLVKVIDADRGWSIVQCEIAAVTIRLITCPCGWRWSWLINCAKWNSGSGLSLVHENGVGHGKDQSSKWMNA